MRDLVDRGFAFKRDRENPCLEIGYIGKTRGQVRDMDVSHVQRPLTLNVSAGVASTHSLSRVAYESAAAAGRNTSTMEAGFEAVVEPRSRTQEGHRRSDVRRFSNEEMINVYNEIERDMNELKNNIGRRINPNDVEAMRIWRERMKSTKKKTLEDIEEKASQLAEAAQRIRDKTYAGARVIEIAPIAEVSANSLDMSANRADRSAVLGFTCIKLTAESSTQVEPGREGKKKKKANKTVKVKKERRGDDDEIAKNKTRQTQD